jgi:shikimate 5-dehydrogenase
MAGTDDGAPIADALQRAPRATGGVAYDLVYRPPAGLDATPFLLRARALGLRPIDGLGMLVEQGVRALSIFLRAPLGDAVRAAMLGAVRDALAARH